MNVVPEQTAHGNWSTYPKVSMSGFGTCSIVVVYNKHGFLASNISAGTDLEKDAMNKLCTTYPSIKSTVFGNQQVKVLILCEQMNIAKGGLMRSAVEKILPTETVVRYYDAASFLGTSSMTPGCEFSIGPGVNGFSAVLKGANGKSAKPLSEPTGILKCP
ncbi:uncharacterized protein N7446_009485 [Penicillium canescens]|uniref:Uncharacterized protein n=1 Tax=Penicillium canescens TaxID=5083 RepID=A0AAD6I6C4_PENCN|nr:uncharacterized protein N7446_009485 [Penicillium canescens]KAJ6034730.1 hypothetical protein N7460_008905 [Penicillium canescens]KAJ6046393.1 hypothetical protein N7444_007647 [Penicillium canescens]KAJ6053473.1 hypothetical protein N7446_009485 [Penicillium canescens]